MYVNFYGCSHTFGLGCSTNYPSIIQQIKSKWIVNNFAICGASLRVNYNLFLTHHFQNSLTILQIPCPSRQSKDFNDNNAYYCYDKNTVSFDLYNCYIKSSLNHIKRKEIYFQKEINLLKTFIDINQKKHNQIFIFYYYFSHRTLQCEFMKGYESILKNFLKENNVPFLIGENFSFPFFKKNKLVLGKRDSHPNYNGHFFIAENILKGLEKINVI